MILMIVENSAIVSVSNDNNLTRDQLASAITQAVKDKKAPLFDPDKKLTIQYLGKSGANQVITSKFQHWDGS